MSNFELAYHLKQESPIIHFQYSVPGATLRASDVKPRLDKFIKEWCRKKHADEFKKWDAEWKISDNKNDYAYNYKLSIDLESKNVSSKPLSGIYFGNLGKGYEDDGKCCRIAENGVNLKIVCFFPKLLEVIDECIRTFFLINNFGTRSNRGYGSFVIKDSPWERYSESELKENIMLIKEWYSDRTIFKIEHDKTTGNEIDDILMEGQYVYQILKSGYNCSQYKKNEKGEYEKENVYIKSYLTTYFLDRGIVGEKRYCKQKGIVPSIKNEHQKIVSDKEIKAERYIRALLGHVGNAKYKETKDANGNVFWVVTNKDTNQKNNWAKPSNKIYKIVDTKKDFVKLVFSDTKPEYDNKNIKVNNVTDTLTIKSSGIGEAKIDRIPSPIFYKVINKEIYIIPKDINCKIEGADFVFKVKRDYNSQWKLDLSENNLCIPKLSDLENLKTYADLLNDIMCKYAENFNENTSKKYKVKKHGHNYSLKKEENNDGTKIRKV